MTSENVPIRPPASADEITNGWLTAALQGRHPGALVTGVEVVSRSQVTNSHARISVAYDSPSTAPSSMFVKVLPTDDRRDAVARTRMGPKEVRFYRELARRLKLRVPEVHVAIEDSSDDTFVLLLEDLVDAGARVSDGTWGVGADGAATALEGLAEMHARFEDPKRRAAEAGWVVEPVWGSTYGSTMLQFGLDHHRDRLSDNFAAIAEAYINDGRRLFELWTTGPKTVIHGDTHIGNLFFEGDTVGFLDWGLIAVNTPMREVSYFLNMAMDIEERRTHEQALLRHYLAARSSYGASPMTFNEAWAAHRLQAAYCVVASCQIVTFPANISVGRTVFSDAFLNRAEAAISDLDALGALREATGR